MSKIFFMNFAEKGRPPYYQHQTLKSVTDEAVRISKRRNGRPVTVLRSFAVVKIVDGEPVWEFTDE